MKHQKTIKYEPITRDHYLHGDLFGKYKMSRIYVYQSYQKMQKVYFFLYLRKR